MRETLKVLGREGAVECRPVPANDSISEGFGGSLHEGECHMVPKRRRSARRAFLDGNFARRKLPLREREYCFWDTELAGFGLRVRPSGNYFWFVRLRHRGKHHRITLGRTDGLEAGLARAQARRMLAAAALDGLPKRAVVKATSTMNDFVEAYWDDLSRVWKPSTAKRNWNAWRLTIMPTFGDMRVADILPLDIHRWRDGCAGESEVKFNRAVPMLSALFKYAEALKMRRPGSNPCRGMPRYKRQSVERYLTPAEYRRIGAALREASAPDEVPCGTHPHPGIRMRMTINRILSALNLPDVAQKTSFSSSPDRARAIMDHAVYTTDMFCHLRYLGLQPRSPFLDTVTANLVVPPEYHKAIYEAWQSVRARIVEGHLGHGEGVVLFLNRPQAIGAQD